MPEPNRLREGEELSKRGKDLLAEFAVFTNASREDTIEWMKTYPPLASNFAHYAFQVWAEDNDVGIVSPEDYADQFKFFVEAWKLPLKGDDDAGTDNDA